MAIYEYKCHACGALLEVIREVDARDEPAACEDCGGRMRRQVPRDTGFLLLGPRWARDGYGGDHDAG